MTGGRFYDIRGEAKLSTNEIARAVPRFERRDPPARWRNRTAERKRGFRPRHLVAVRVDWRVTALQAAYRAWRSVRRIGGLFGRELRLWHAIASRQGIGRYDPERRTLTGPDGTERPMPRGHRRRPAQERPGR